MTGYYQIGEAARRAGVTIETLRHYDRIGLVTPCKVDRQTGYRYYSDFEVDQVQVIRYLRSIKFPLSTIHKLFSQDDIPAAVETLHPAYQKVDEEIEHLLVVKQHLQDTLDNYRSKRNTRDYIPSLPVPTVRQEPERTIFLAQGLHVPTLGTLSQLYTMVEGQIDPELRPQFQFENDSGVLIRGESSSLFARCLRSVPHPAVTTLPGGRYLCISCADQDYQPTVEQLRRLAAERFLVENSPVVLDIVFTGLIQWEYGVKLFLGSALHEDHGSNDARKGN